MSTQAHHSDTQILPFDDRAIEAAAALIRQGAVVAVPTETVYGLAARADSGEAVAAIYAAKGRPSFNPLIVHVGSVEQARQIAEVDALASALMERYWPGPLTLVLPLRTDAPVASLATAGLGTVALRMPAHPAMQQLIRQSGLPLAAPSANASGSISPTRADHVAASLGGRIPLVIDAGPTRLGLESTIVRPVGGHVEILRPGPVTADDLEREGFAIDSPERTDRISAPGQLSSHYAPSKPLRLDATERRDGEWMIGFGPVEGDVSLSATGDLGEAAARLFDLLHQADSSDRAAIAVAPVPPQGLGEAINDRLRRAAAPRPLTGDLPR